MIDQKTFAFPFDDEDWVNKFLIGSLLHLVAPFLLYIPIIVPLGYSLRVWRDAIAGLPGRLPAWDKWEDMGLQGLIYCLIVFLYSLPLCLLGTVAVAIAIGGGVATGWITSESEEAGVAAALFLVLGFGVLTLVGLILSLLIGFLFPMGVSRYLETGRFGAAFEFGAVWRAVRANLGGLLVVWVVVLAVGLVLGSVVSLVSTIFCWIPFAGYLLMAPAGFYVSLVQARLMGQVYRKAQLRLGDTPLAQVAPVAPEPVEEERQVPADVPLESLGLSARVIRVLHEAGIANVGHLLEKLAEGDAALLSIRGVGAKALSEIKAQLAIHGFLDAS